MCIASLLNLLTDFIHSEVDNLESILYTILAVCTYTNGPAMLRFSIPEEQSIPMNRWFYKSSQKKLACQKDNTLSYFSKHIKSHLPKYWNDFAPYLKWFIDACWELPTCFLDQPNVATHNKFIKILDDMICHYETNGKQAISYAYIPPTADISPLEKWHRHEGEVAEQQAHKLAHTGD